MKAENGKTYAVIADNEVSYIFDSEECKEWDEKSIRAVEIPDDKKDEIKIGTKFDTNKNEFMLLTLEELKEEVGIKMDYYFQREAMYLRGYKTEEEVRSYQDQLREAKEYRQDTNAHTPMLDSLSKQRNTTKEYLVNKIIEKNEKYLLQFGLLLGYRQTLQKQINNATTIQELKDLQYISPLKA